MPQILAILYKNLYEKSYLLTLSKSIVENRNLLIHNISKDDRKVALRIIDAFNMICNVLNCDISDICETMKLENKELDLTLNNIV